MEALLEKQKPITEKKKKKIELESTH
jgi:hypothetical protein